MSDIKNPLSNLELEAWYKIGIAVSASILLLSLFFDIKGIENNIVQLISLGVLIICLGEWKQHPKQQHYVPASYANPDMLVTTRHRQANLLGSLFDILGFIIFTLGVKQILE